LTFKRRRRIITRNELENQTLLRVHGDLYIN
jgi:hypothetical protein